MKKQLKSTKSTTKITSPSLDFKNRREIISNSIPVEVDLENGEVFFQDDVAEKLKLDFISNDINSLIKPVLILKTRGK